MKYLAAYLLTTMGGNKSPTAKDIENVLGSVGLDVDMEDANKVVSALSGKSINEVITAGLAKISSVPSGDAAAAAAAVASVVSAPPGASEAESKKEDKKEEPKEESDEDMGFGLFD